MRVAIIGASGFVGFHLLNEALSRRHEVAAISREPEKIAMHHENLSAMKCDVLDINKTAQHLSACEAVISAYHVGWENPDLYNDYLKGSKCILEAVKRANISRFLTIGTAGGSDVELNVSETNPLIFPTQWKAGSLASKEFLEILTKEDRLDWTFICPALNLKSGKRTATFQTGDPSLIEDNSWISVEDLAVAVIDELENPKYIRSKFMVGYSLDI
jgi:uncharacterized protein